MTVNIIPNVEQFTNPTSDMLVGIDAIHWLAQHGGQFVLPRGRSKSAFAPGWNRPDAGASASAAAYHYHNGGNVGLHLYDDLFIIDIDINAESQLARLGALADTVRISRDNAPDRTALLYRAEGWQPQAHTWKPAGETRPHVELLARSSKNTAKHKLIAGSYDNGTYQLTHTDQGIQTLNETTFVGLWVLLTGAFLTQHERTVPQASPDEYGDDTVSRIKAHWTPIMVFQHHGWDKNGTREEADGRIRFLKHGGLLADDARWHCYAEEAAGDSIAAWQWCRTEGQSYHTDDPQIFKTILAEMAAAANLSLDLHTHTHIQLPSGQHAPLADILDFARLYIAAHTFTGRSGDRQRHCALGAIQLMERWNSIQAPMSQRMLADMSGVTGKTARDALHGRDEMITATDAQGTPLPLMIAAKDGHGVKRDDHGNVIYEAKTTKTGAPVYKKVPSGRKLTEALTDWLLVRIERGNGVFADKYRLQDTVLTAYEDYARNVTASNYSAGDGPTTPNCSQMRLFIACIETHMDGDAFQSNVVPEVLRGKSYLLKAFTPLGLHMVALLSLENEGLSLSDLSHHLNCQPRTVSACVARMSDSLAERGFAPLLTVEPDLMDARRRLVYLDSEWETTLLDVESSLFTQGMVQRRKARHASERKRRLKPIMQNTTDKGLLEEYQRIYEWNETFLTGIAGGASIQGEPFAAAMRGRYVLPPHDHHTAEVSASPAPDPVPEAKPLAQIGHWSLFQEPEEVFATLRGVITHGLDIQPALDWLFGKTPDMVEVLFSFARLEWGDTGAIIVAKVRESYGVA